MITITQAAAEQIRKSATESGLETPVLRIAAQVAADGSIDFGMGFDQSRSGDTATQVDGIDLVVAARSLELVEGARIDFVEIEPGDFRFIFAPADEEEAG
jgi:iron-sulfur cluster assembly protein